MGVNAAAFVRYYLRERKSLDESRSSGARLFDLLFIWLHLGWQAKLAGGIWMAAGIIYGAIKTKGFQRKLVQFDFPVDD